VGRSRDRHRAEDAAPREVGGGRAEEAQGRALPGLPRVSHHEHGVQGEERGGELRVRVVVNGLAPDRRHAPQHAGGDGRPAGDREEARGDRVGDGRVHHVLQGGRGPDLEVLVLHLQAGQPEPHEVEHVRDARVRGEQPRAAGERRRALRGELLGLLDPRGTVVAADAPREQWSLPPREQEEILAASRHGLGGGAPVEETRAAHVGGAACNIGGTAQRKNADEGRPT
jgi:hypothetical protein